MGVYCASKFALAALAESDHHELAPPGIDDGGGGGRRSAGGGGEAMCRLIAMPAGQRPLRTSVGAGADGVAAINAACVQVQAGLPWAGSGRPAGS
ncbi:MAG: hypothetical protein JNK56_39340 [Myxococcales bacterium]|nr:hypothetical protein [Myxococcales bacterium]